MGTFLVLGGSGFIGGHLVRYLLDQGADVATLSRRQPVAGGNAQHLTMDAGQHVEELQAAVGRLRPSTIVNLIGGRDGSGWEHTLLSFRLARFLAERHPGVRLVLVGSAAEYGRPVALPVDETHALRPASEYGFAKAAQSWMAHALHQETAMAVLVARIFNAAGPGQSPAYVLGSAVSQAVDILSGSRRRARLGHVDAVRDFVDVRDVARALASIAATGRPGEAYNVCSGRPTPVRDALRHLGRLCGLPQDFYTAEPGPMRDDVAEIYGSNQKIEQETGWRPAIDLDRMLEDMVAHEKAGRLRHSAEV